MAKRTDLAMEAREIWRESAGETTRLPGVRARETGGRGITVTVVEILDERGARALQKPVGKYVTLEMKRGLLQEPAGFARAAARLGKVLSSMVPAAGPVLVAGLGNGAVTPDAIGPKCLEHLVVTRHLGGHFPQLRSVSAIAPGVLGITGLETVEVIRGIVERSRPCCVVAVDALASRSPARLCAAVQVADTGITPGAGVGNRREALDRDSLGVPVIAVGVPTVVDFSTILEDISAKNGREHWENAEFNQPGMVVTPGDIDAGVARLARFLGFGISLGLHRNLSVEDISCFTG